MKTLNLSAADFLSKHIEIDRSNQKEMAKGYDKKAESFVDYLREGVANVNEYQKTADKMAQDVATGKSENLHETMLALSQAELSFNFMVQVRNKVIESYQEVMRMQV